MSDFQHLPSQKEVMEYDPRWIEDMHLAHGIYSFYRNSSSVMKLFDQAMAAKNVHTTASEEEQIKSGVYENPHNLDYSNEISRQSQTSDEVIQQFPYLKNKYMAHLD